MKINLRFWAYRVEDYISDIIILIEHIASISLLSTEHQIFLADVNQDNNINVSDIIIIIDQILNN